MILCPLLLNIYTSNSMLTIICTTSTNNTKEYNKLLVQMLIYLSGAHGAILLLHRLRTAPLATLCLASLVGVAALVM